MIIVGISAYHPDSACVILKDGEIIWAAEEERFNRKKHSSEFPRLSLKKGLDFCKLKPTDISSIAFAKNSHMHLLRKVWSSLKYQPKLSFIRNKVKKLNTVDVFLKDCKDVLGLSANGKKVRYEFIEHHQAHIASSFYASGYENASCVSIDGFGDFVSMMDVDASLSTGIEIKNRVFFPHSLGMLYTAATQYIGFATYGDEYKVMGLAAYGKPKYVDQFRQMLFFEPKGTFKLNLEYFNHHKGHDFRSKGDVITEGIIYSDVWYEVFGGPCGSSKKITQRSMDIARSVQAVLEEAYSHILNSAYGRGHSKNLCLAGGVTLNGVANGKVKSMTDFENVFIQGAANDAGIALGAAAIAHNRLSNKPAILQGQHASFGPSYSNSEILSALRRHNLEYEILADRDLVGVVAEHLSQGDIVGWFQGRMEFGPRALGQRSILADPRSRSMMDDLNERIKNREAFRPFAPIVPVERASEYFEMDCQTAPFMIKVFKVKKELKSTIPAVTHVDGTARVQTVCREYQAKLWNLLASFEKITNVAVLLNTSFNENEPIVCNPDDAIQCFLRTKMDVLVIENYVIRRKNE